MDKTKWSEKITNDEFFERIEEKRTLQNNMLNRKGNWIGHILRRNFLPNDGNDGLMTEEEKSKKNNKIAPR
jgi:hypothetical protein